MNQRFFVPVLLTIIFPILSAAQQTQTLRDRDPDLAGAKKLASDLQQANFHAGPFYLMSRLRLADAGYTETGFLPTGDQGGGLSLVVEAPQRLYFVPAKKTIFSIEAVPGYAFFREGERGNQFNYLVRGDAHFLFNHLYLDVYALRADQLRAHVADINRLATTREDEYGVVGEVKYSSRTSALFNARLRDTSYPEDRFQPDPAPEPLFDLEVLDRSERNGRVSFHHKTFGHTGLFVAAEASKYDFRNVERYDSSRTYYGAGFLHDRGRTQLRFEAGPVRLDFDDPTLRDYDGVNAHLQASRSNGRWTLMFSAGRDIGFSIFAQNPYYIATSGSVGVDYIATRRLTLHARSSAERDEYETPVFNQERTDDVSFTSAGFTYGIRRVRFGADVGWYERDTTAFGDVDSGIRYVLRLSFTP